jgi:hypothetical protein
MNKSLFVILGIVGIISISLAFTPRDEHTYKNLKVLPKNINKEQLDSVMHHFTGSLGVKCNYCHMRNEETKTWDFASDENKHKLAAREMMKMMEKINDKYFDVTGARQDLNAKLMVTCFTCHHGSTEPATKTPKIEEPPRRDNDSTRNNQQ